MVRRKTKVKAVATRKEMVAETLVDGTIEMKTTPEWILNRFPTLKREMPKQIVEELDECRNKTQQASADLGEKTVDLEKQTIAAYMVNFTYKLYYNLLTCDDVKLKEKIGDSVSASGRYGSEKIRNSTYGEFLAEIKTTIEECGLSVEKGRELANTWDYVTESSFYLFPVFLRLMEKGYKRDPDLTA